MKCRMSARQCVCCTELSLPVGGRQHVALRTYHRDTQDVGCRGGGRKCRMPGAIRKSVPTRSRNSAGTLRERSSGSRLLWLEIQGNRSMAPDEGAAGKGSQGCRLPCVDMHASTVSTVACARRAAWNVIRISTSGSSGLQPFSTASAMRKTPSTRRSRRLWKVAGCTARACHISNPTTAMSHGGLRADSSGRRDIRPGEPELSRRMDGPGRETPSALPRRVLLPDRRAHRC